MIDRRRLAKANSGESNASAVTGQGLGGYAAAAMLCVDSDDVDTVIMTSHVIKSKSISFFVVGRDGCRRAMGGKCAVPGTTAGRLNDRINSLFVQQLRCAL